jgi:hypothetical protein
MKFYQKPLFRKRQFAAANIVTGIANGQRSVRKSRPCAR